MGFDWIALAEYSAIGVLSGGLLALIALGFVLIYKGTGVINFAMGEFMMLGAYFVFTAHVLWKLPLPVALGLPWPRWRCAPRWSSAWCCGRWPGSR